MISTDTSTATGVLTSSTQTIVLGFYFMANTDLVVTRTRAGVITTLTLDSDYSVAGAGHESGGSITVTGQASGDVITIVRTVPYTQLVDLVPLTKLSETLLERALDKLTMLCQQLKRSVDASGLLPTRTASTSLGVDGAGNWIQRSASELFTFLKTYGGFFGTTSGTVAAGDDSRIVAGGTALQPAGSGASLTGITAAQVGLGNVDNTSDANKPVSTAQATALSAKAPVDNPTFTTGITTPAANITGLTASRALVSDASKNVTASAVTSTELGYVHGVTSAIQAQFAAKAPLASPALTGIPTAPTASSGTSNTQLATTAFSQRLKRRYGGHTGPLVAHRNYLNSTTWLSSTSAADNQWLSICWSAELGLFCAIASSGSSNRVMTSPNGITWTIRTSAADNQWWSVCWSPELGLFCAVSYDGAGNRVMTSPDGITWTIRTSAADNQWASVCWSPELGLFCAVAATGSSNRVMTSPDGITWTLRTSAGDNEWRSVCWSPELGLFCAIASSGSSNRVMTSPDGITWTIRTSAADNGWLSVCWSPELGLFCAIAIYGSGNRVMTSPDGITWTLRTSAGENQWRSVCWSPELGLFCAIANSGSSNRVMTSPDGITWTLRTSAADNDWRSVCWSAELGLFCAVAISGSGNRVMTSISAWSMSYRTT